MTQLRGPERGPASGGRPRGLVVLLHGLGADGADLIGLADHWGRALPDCLFLVPDAPERCDMAPAGRQWFSVRDRREAAMRAGVERAAAALGPFLDDALARHGLDGARLALAGFSQGAMLALHAGPRRSPPPACLVAFSGRLIGGEELARAAAGRPPAMLVHGDADDVVPPESLHEAQAALGAAGFSAQWHVSRGVGHGIAPDGLAIGGRFLRDCLAAPPP